ncbi:MAG TPA: oligosaccharide flippase family protein, partial [Candidatus Polarisedimenticolia bacterium]|nr:oligosaccharide flippase family protein [Candidatus Polarisedimenticolia bacterium]
MSDLPGAPAVLPPGGERRAAVRGVAWGGVEAATGALVGFLLTPLVVRAAGIEGLGLWAASWSLAHTAGLLDLGVSASYARFTARAIATGDTRALNGTVGAGVGFHLALSSLVAIGALAGAPLALARLTPPGAPRGEVVVVLFATLAVVLLRLTLSAYRGVVAGAQRIDLLGRIGAAVALLEGCGAAAALALGFGLRGMALNSLASAMLACLAEGIIAHAVCPGLRLRPFAARRSDWREILTFGLNLQASRAAEILAAHVPRLALALGPGLAQAGAYDLAARVASALNVAGALPLPVVQPLASRLEARGDRIRLRALLARAS